MGIVRMPKLFLDDALDDGRRVQLRWNHAAPPVTLGVVCPSRRELPAEVRAWIDFLLEWQRSL
jgi:DNA-binding transcriptional LysR family regulator